MELETIGQSVSISEAELGTIVQLNHEGDTTYTWDRTNEAECKAAEEHFNSLKSKGFLAFKVRRGRRSATESTFDSTAGKYTYKAPEMTTAFNPKENYVVTPQLKGG